MFHVEHHQDVRSLIKDGADLLGLPVNEQVLSKFESYINELCRWNNKINLTGLKNQDDIAITLVVDSLVCGLVLSPERNQSILDVGSGGGFPGIPLKITNSELNITLLEPQLKKIAFLHYIIGTLDLGTVEVLARRVEDLAKDQSYHRKFDYVVTKALNIESIVPFGPSLLRSTGKMALFRSQPLSISVKEFGMRLIREFPYELPFGFGPRMLSILGPL